MAVAEVTVTLRRPHPHQAQVMQSPAKRIIVRAGRRGGKTVGAATIGVRRFLDGSRVLYAAPTTEQTDAFWYEVNRALGDLVTRGVYRRNESERYIERAGTKQRIKARTAWSADTLRGDFADLLILDEWQLMAEDTWALVGAPMLLDNDGDALFIYTPPSLRSLGVSKAADPRHAAQMFRTAQANQTGRWAAFHWTSLDNPHISPVALDELSGDMSAAAYRQEILAEDDDLLPSQLVYGCFSAVSQVIPRFPIPDSWPWYVGHDFGGANPAALFLSQDPGTGYVYLVQEYRPGPGRSVAQHVEAWTGLTAGRHVVKRLGGSHQEDEVRQAYTAHGWPITEPGIRGVLAGIDRVRGLMQLNKLFVFNDLSYTREELATYRWKLDSAGLSTDDIEDKARYHLMDTLRYVLSDFRPETAVNARPRVANRNRF